MPYQLKKPCLQFGCPALVDPPASRCPRHKKEHAREYERNRPNASQRGYGWKWQEYRKDYLKHHPICANPYNLHHPYVPATCVDHIVAISGPDDPRFYDPTNHRALCDKCHRSKTARNDGGLGNPVK